MNTLSHFIDNHPRTTLQHLISQILSHAKESKERDVAVREILAFLDFTNTSPECGYLTRTWNAITHHPSVLAYLARRATELRGETTRRGNLWFRTRIAVMDACTAGAMLDDKSEWKIFYGGRLHAHNLMNIFCEYDYECDDELTHLAKKYMPFAKSIMVRGIRMTFLGEIHPDTSMDFSFKFLKFCNDRCHDSVSMSVFLEKHPSNQKDRLQQHITCNLKDTHALQSIRCAFPFSNCPMVKSVDVDFRHVELGFLRYDFLESAEQTNHLSTLSESWQRECLDHIFSMCVHAFASPKRRRIGG